MHEFSPSFCMAKIWVLPTLLLVVNNCFNVCFSFELNIQKQKYVANKHSIFVTKCSVQFKIKVLSSFSFLFKLRYAKNWSFCNKVDTINPLLSFATQNIWRCKQRWEKDTKIRDINQTHSKHKEIRDYVSWIYS